MPLKDPAARRAYDKARRKTAKYKAVKAEYERSLRSLARQKQYRQSKRGVAAHRRSRGHPDPTRPAPTRCECCNGPPTGRGGLHLDHDHTTGKFRGWLCNKCNAGIGMLGDTALGVRFALAYLTLNG